ncbi:MAG: RagB/SusD family nutrient uptake outer membrane protein [Dysgonamonadaceae bacterium]|jgi:hypothetical protein|nr:RagB/SusD family nutrient uptake outer membrane protein [Dysgonamonadaceae bacterium]
MKGKTLFINSDYDASLKGYPVDIGPPCSPYKVQGSYGSNFGLLGIIPTMRAAFITNDNCPNIADKNEFFVEYSFWYDLCRMGLAKEYLDAEYPQNTEDSNRIQIPGETEDVLITNPHTLSKYQHETGRELYSIPYAEIMKNPALSDADQNPGYTGGN